LIESEYRGGLQMWEQAIRKAASSARGWVMVGYDLNDGSLFNYIMDTQNLWAVYNMVPVLALDVYEHAYARDYGATPDGRKQYIDAFFRNIDWEHVNRQLHQAQAAKQGADSAASQEQVPVGS
jgi:superoxide dismutase, Fe-Mn family